MKNSEPLPMDLIIEIVSKLPVKSIARFRCVSRDWACVLRSPYPTNLFLKVSSSRPRLLFATHSNSKLLFLSTPQPLNPDNNSSSLASEYQMCFPMVDSAHDFQAPVNGLVCTKSLAWKRDFNDSMMMIYNPSTGQSIPLPIMRRTCVPVLTFLGFDPINKQHKVLSMIVSRDPFKSTNDYQVMTLGIEKPSWKPVECSFPHMPFFSTLCSAICINGVLYYFCYHGNENILVCFDVRSEKFKIIEASDKVSVFSRLINYSGKFGVFVNSILSGYSTSLELLVLDDVEKNEWSQHVFILPPLWNYLVVKTHVFIVGMTRNGELVFSPRALRCELFYIVFYNVEKNTLARLRIQGLESIKDPSMIYTFIDYVDNVELI